MFQKDLQDLERLILELDLDAPLAQLPGAQIHFEHAEANRPTRWMSTLHRDESSKRLPKLPLFRKTAAKTTLRRKVHASHQVLKAWVSAQVIDSWIGLQTHR